MAFAFGAASSGPPAQSQTSSTPTATGGGGGFSFGSIAASGTTATAAASQAPGGFAFGSTTAAPAPAFGSFGAPSPAPGISYTAPATPAPSTGLSFGSSATPAPAAPATAGFSFGGSSAPASAPQPSFHPTQRLKIPGYHSLFHGATFRSVKAVASKTLKSSSRLNADELEDLIQKHAPLLLNLTPPAPQQPNLAIRQSLASHLEVEIQGEIATLTIDRLQKIFEVADYLRVNEETAICLCFQVSSFVDWPQAARQAWLAEQRLPVETLLWLSQCRLESPSVVQATDTLLQNHSLIPKILQAIRDYTTMIHNLLNELSHIRDTTGSHAFSSMSLDMSQQTINPSEQLARDHMMFAAAQRQTLCHVLFFLSYHTQWVGDEVAALVDLIRDLSNDKLLKVLDPFEDVPSAFEEDTRSSVAAAWMNQQWHQQTPSKLYAKEKDKLQWERDLVKQSLMSGQPELLKCVATLVMTVVGTLDTRLELVDRSTHRFNSFGTGNALLPPGTNSIDRLAQIHCRLNINAAKDWQRTDVFGVLSAAYALLLRPPSPSLSSPRATSNFASPPFGPGICSIDIPKTWRECLKAPAEFKSFTFCRLGLLPALLGTNVLPIADGTPYIISNHSDTERCDTTAFLLEVLCRFASCYTHVLSFSVDLLTSRKKWEQDEAESLQLSRLQQERNLNFHETFGTEAVQTMQMALPTCVDLLQRPDCLDDVFAFAGAVCSLEPVYSSIFWCEQEKLNETGSSDGIQSQRVPFRALLTLDRLQEDDGSLLPSYLSLLAALALDKSGAEAIHGMLSNGAEDGRNSQVTWTSLIEKLHWFIGELSSPDYGGVSVTTALKSPTSYYYYDYEETKTASGASTFAPWNSGESTTFPKTFELDGSSTFALLSHLNVVSSVCRNCPEARLAVLSTNLPRQGASIFGSTEIVGQNLVLAILFTLAVAPVRPNVRGAVFTTLSNVLMATPSDLMTETSESFIFKIRESALTAWQLVEQCQILPICLLDQYQPPTDKHTKNSTGLSFPPESKALASDKPGESCVPCNEKYSILYELVYVETAEGVYPSTEGFLRLLRSLFSLAGSPRDLGITSGRIRCGCAPYIEYVMDLVLPRAVGTSQDGSVLPFRSFQDRSRLIALALEVVEVTVTKYQLPSNLPIGSMLQPKEVADNHRRTSKIALEKLCIRSLANHVVSEPSLDDSNLFICDWQPSPTEAAQSANGNRMDAPLRTSSLSNQNVFIPSQTSCAIPRPKSPALSVLVGLLHSSGRQLLRSIIAVLAGSRVCREKCADADALSLAYALFNATPPTFSSAKIGTKKATVLPPQSLLMPLQGELERPSYGHAVEWEERAILLALNVLCAAVAREDELLAVVNSCKSSLSIVPVLSFRKHSAQRDSSSLLDISSLQLFKLSQLSLFSADSLGQIVDLVGYTSVNDARDTEIARAAIALVFYFDKSLINRASAAGFFSTAAKGKVNLAQAFGRRLVTSGERLDSTNDVEIVKVVFNRILSELRKEFSPLGISNALLGFPPSSSGVDGDYLLSVSEIPNANCFNAILTILNCESILTSIRGTKLATMGYEIFARLMTSPTRMQFTAKILRSKDFRAHHLAKIVELLRPRLEASYDCVELLHSTAWLLTTLASEIHLVQSLGVEQFNKLVQIIYASPEEILGSLVNLFRFLFVRCPEFSLNTVRPTEDALKKAKVKLNGAPEVVEGYEIVDDHILVETSKVADGGATAGDLKAWCETYNKIIAMDCATAHVSSAIHLVLRTTVAVDPSLLSRLPAVRTGWNNLLRDLLHTLSIPNKCYSTAMRNLAVAALVVTAETTDTGSLWSLAAVAIERMDDSLDTITPDFIRHEQTALLGTILCLLLEKPAGDLIENDAKSCVHSAYALSKLAYTSPGHHSGQTLIPCTCLGVILEKLREASLLNGNHRFLQHILHKEHNGSTFASHLAFLAANRDSNATLLLQKISTLPYGASILLNSGVLNELSDAASKFASVSLPDREIEVPPFLPAQLELMILLMVHDYEEEGIHSLATSCSEILSKCCVILSKYWQVLDRFIEHFPKHVDMVQLVARCFWCIKTLLRKLGNRQSVGISKDEQTSLEQIETRLLTFAVHIAENPLPLNFLTALPDDWLPPRNALSSLSTNKKSWWEFLKIGHHDTSAYGQQQITSEMLAYAVKAAAIAKNILLGYLVYPLPFSATLDSRAITRCVCRCSGAVRIINLSSQDPLLRNDVNAFGECCKLRDLMSDIMVELLAILLRHVQHVTSVIGSGAGVESAFELKQTIQETLDRCQLEGSEFQSMNVNNAAYVVALAKTLRCELDHL